MNTAPEDTRPPTTRWRDRLHRWRERLRHRPVANQVYRFTVAVVGALVLAAGVIAIPYPGPGWAIVFVGLAILAAEFAWARGLLHFSRRHYDAVMAWYGRQGLAVRILGALLTTAVVLVSLWVFGALSIMARLVGIDRPWLDSPIGLG